MSADLRAARRLSLGVLALLAVVSAGGWFATGWLYRDNPLVTAAWRGQDLVTLVVAVPLMAVAMWFERRGSTWGRLCWLAMLAYSAYGYLFYAFGAAFNAFFLLYVALFACSMYALAFSLPRIDVGELVGGFGGRVARIAAITYMGVSALGLGALWTAMSASYLLTGKVPAPIVATGHPTGVVFALDLSIIVPLMAIGVVQLLRRRPWGWLIAAIMSVKGTVYTLGLSVATVIVSRSGVGSGAELPIWVVLTVLGAISTTALVLDSRRGARDERAESGARGARGERAG